VFKAVHERLSKFVAIKVHTSHSCVSSRSWQHMLEEAQVLARLDHPNIVQIYDYDEIEHIPYLVLEYLDGGSLAQELSTARLHPHQAVELLLPITRAIQYAHENGVVHRDIKPSNVLFGKKGKPKVVDFGLATFTSQSSCLSQTDKIVGTPAYMAPEQVVGNECAVLPSVDIYALGAVLYEMLTGRPVFSGTSVSELMGKVQHCDPCPPSSIRSDVPTELDTICLKCLAKQPEERYCLAGELAEVLERYLLHRPVKAHFVRWRRFKKWSHKRVNTAPHVV
jgi:eukaryotic-like serine/threonine-protein kinase